MMKPTSATTVKSKSTMYLNEESFHSNQGNIVRFLRSLVLSKNNSHGLGQGKLGKSRVFGRDLKLHLTETRQESKFFWESYLKGRACSDYSVVNQNKSHKTLCQCKDFPRSSPGRGSPPVSRATKKAQACAYPFRVLIIFRLIAMTRSFAAA